MRRVFFIDNSSVLETLKTQSLQRSALKTAEMELADARKKINELEDKNTATVQKMTREKEELIEIVDALSGERKGQRFLSSCE